MLIKGLDLSVCNKNLPWPVVKAEGYRFAVIRCAEGNNVVGPGTPPERRYRDGMFDTHLAGARSVGVIPFAYFVPFPLHHINPITHARIFFDSCDGLGSKPGEGPPMVDFEWPTPENWGKWGCDKSQLKTFALAFLPEVERLWSEAAGEVIVPMLYEYPWFNHELDDDADLDFARYPLVLADYRAAGRIPDASEWPAALKPWTEVTMWQSDGTGGLGIGPLDVDVDFMRDEDALFRLARIPLAMPAVLHDSTEIVEQAVTEYQRATG